MVDGSYLCGTIRWRVEADFARMSHCHCSMCRTCGSGMPRADHGRGIAVVPLGSLDDDPGTGAVDHIFVGSKAQWYTITDDLPRFDAAPA
jgi:hypothetical protein